MTTIYSPRRPSSVEESKIMEFGLRLHIEKLEAKLKNYQRDKKYLCDRNKNLEVIIEIHKIDEKYKEKKIQTRKIIQKNYVRKLKD